MNMILRFSQNRKRITLACVIIALFATYSYSDFSQLIKEDEVARNFQYVNLGQHEGFDKDHSRLLEKNPDVLSLTLATARKSYSIGELIPITLKYSNTSDLSYSVFYMQHDRSGRFRQINFHVEGQDGGFVDPMATHGEGMGGGLGGEDYGLGECSLRLELNWWVRFDKPGKYRLYCMTTNVSERYANGRDAVGLVSSIAEITILPADKDTTAEIIAECKRLLSLRHGDQRLEVFRRLAYLGNEEAVMLMLPYLSYEGDDFALRRMRYKSYMGMIGSRDRQKTLDIMLKNMSDPEVAVNSWYIMTLVDLALPYDEHLKGLQAYMEVEDAQQAYSEHRGNEKLLEHKYMQKLVPLCKAKKGKAYEDTCKFLISKGFTVEGAPQELVYKYTPVQKKIPRPKSDYEKEIERLQNFVDTDPITEFDWSVKDVPEDIVRIIEKYKQEFHKPHAQYVIEYALNLHLKNLQYTNLARELPVDNNILLSEFVRLAEIPKYKTAYEAGWLYSQFDGNFNRKGYSSYQVYVWYLELINRHDCRYSNAERLEEICRQIEQTGMHGVGGGRVCHYWCR